MKGKISIFSGGKKKTGNRFGLPVDRATVSHDIGNRVNKWHFPWKNVRTFLTINLKNNIIETGNAPGKRLQRDAAYVDKVTWKNASLFYIFLA